MLALLFAILTTVQKIIEYQLQQICGGTITVLPAKTHSHKIGTRYPVLVSSSILNNWQGMRSMNGYQGDDIHIDFITIPEATVRELEHAFMAEYGNVHRPVDVLLVPGLNDILRGATDSEIMEDIIISEAQ